MNILEKIITIKEEEISILKKKYSADSFRGWEFFQKDCLRLQKRSDGLSIIAEIKKASPSKGIIKEDFNYLEIARIYQENKVDAISVLTDERFFSGSITFLNAIAKTKSVPLLRKDFIIDELQVFESKANGADLILLIAEVLSAEQIKDLTQTAKEIGLDVLLEMHSAKELDKIDFGLNKVIGINNRNLEDFSVSLETTRELSLLLPGDIIIVSESGISSKDDINVIKATKASCILVGELLMSSDDIQSKILELKNWRRYEN